MSDLLKDRVALITGGARGQGRAHALASAEAGAHVVLFDTSEQIASSPYPTASADDLAQTVKDVQALGRRAIAVDGDVRSQDDLDRSVQIGLSELGRIDILIANAGIWGRAAFWEMTDQEWDDTIDINLSGVWKSAKAVAPHMIERQSGSIIITSSVRGVQAGAGSAHYGASKHGVLGLMKTMALELAPHGVRCNAILPGSVRTPMVDNPWAWKLFSGKDSGTTEDVDTAGSRFHALKGSGAMAPESLANTGVFLNSDLAREITGSEIVVDAGHLLLDGFNHAPVL